MLLLLIGRLILVYFGNHNLYACIKLLVFTCVLVCISPRSCWMPGVRKCQQELKRLRDVLIKLREEETKLKEKQGNEDRIKELSEEQRRLRQEQRKLRIEEAKLVTDRKTFYQEHNIPLEEDERKKLNNSDFANADSGSNYEDVNVNVYNDNDSGNYGDNDQVLEQVFDGGEHYSYGHDERQDNYSNGERQGNRQGQPKMKKVERIVAQEGGVELGLFRISNQSLT